MSEELKRNAVEFGVWTSNYLKVALKCFNTKSYDLSFHGPVEGQRIQRCLLKISHLQVTT